MSAPGAAQGGPVRPVVALALACISFVALLIFGFGMLSLALNADVIATPGLGPVPGVAGVVVALGAFGATLWNSLRRAGAERGDAPQRGAASGAGSASRSDAASGSGSSSATEPGANPRPAGTGPSYRSALWIALASAAGYVVSVWVAVIFASGDLAVATSVAARLVTSWFAAVVLVAGAVAAWGGIALVRTRAQRPRWPWEDEFDE